jgi:hypothetical protein
MSLLTYGLKVARIRGQKSRRAMNEGTGLTHAPNKIRMNSAFGAVNGEKRGCSMDFGGVSAYVGVSILVASRSDPPLSRRLFAVSFEKSPLAVECPRGAI